MIIIECIRDKNLLKVVTAMKAVEGFKIQISAFKFKVCGLSSLSLAGEAMEGALAL